MRTLSVQNKWQPWKGILLQAFALALLLTVGTYIQNRFELIGVALTELLFLVLSVGYTLAQRTPLKEVFPIKKPSVRDVFGVLFLWGGGLMFGMMSIYLMATLMPAYFFSVLDSLNGALTGKGPVITFLIVAILAPICEESLERGAVLSHFRSLKHEWMTIVIIGLFFGIMHVDAIRFLNTFTMGCVCAYLMVKKNNFLLPVILHFVNNGFSEIVSLASGSTEEDLDAAIELMKGFDMRIALGGAMILYCAAPFLMAVGIQLMQDKLSKDASADERRSRSRYLQKNYITATVITCALLLGGAAIIVTTPNFREIYSNAYAETYTKAAEGLLLIMSGF